MSSFAEQRGFAALAVSAWVWYIVAAVIAMPLVAAGFACLNGVRVGVAQVESAIGHLGAILGTANASTLDIQPVAEYVGGNASALKAATGPLGASAVLLDDASFLDTLASNLSTGAATASAALTATVGALGPAIQAGGAVAAGFSLDGLTTQVWSAGIAALTLLLVFLVLSAATLLGRKPRAAEAFRLCACVILAALAFSWVLTAALFAFALVGADICVAPAVALLRVLNSSLSGGQGDPGVAYTTAAYFSSPCGTTPPAGALGYIQAEQNAATAMLNGVSQLQLQLSNESVAVGDAARPFIAALTTLAAQGSSLANQSAADLACSALHDGAWLEV